MDAINIGLEPKSLAMLMVSKELADLDGSKNYLNKEFREVMDSATSWSNSYHIKAVYINNLQKKANGRETLVVGGKEYNVLKLAQKIERQANKFFDKAKNAMLHLQFNTTDNAPFQNAWKKITPKRFGISPLRFVIPRNTGT
jgi:hypothetical protein